MLKIFGSFLFLLTGCSHLEYANIYFADTANKYRCDAQTYTQSMIEEYLNPTPENLKEAERITGYSDCTSTKPDSDSVLWSCKKPSPYTTLTTTKLAICHKFMSDNGLK
jgi:hypothetical protein